jgi:tol-pal system protein YbgF
MQTQLVELNAQVRAMRAEGARLESRLEKLEQQVAVGTSRGAAAPVSAKAAAVLEKEKNEPLPNLTVVKLKPKKEAAPKINTEVAVVEPAEGLVSELKAVASDSKDNSPSDELEPHLADEQYEQGVSALKTGNVEGAVKTLTTFSQDYPKHPRADNALYFAGVGQMALKEYENAEKTFHEALTRYPAGDTVLDSMLKLAECRFKLNRPQDAKATWEKIVAGFPGTAAATQAQQRLASLSAGKPASPE